MKNSRDLAELRSDVRANVETLLAMCKAQGLQVLITQTVRDNEYQAYLYAQGRTRPGQIITNSKVTTFHGAGLAVDFCRNIKGQEYSDVGFFQNVAAIAKHIGFSWGGDWKTFVDRPHLQWDDHGKYTTAMLKSGVPAPRMPKFEEDEDMDQTKFNKMFKTAMADYRAELARQSAADWAKAAWDRLTKRGVTDGSRPADLITRQEVAAMLERTER